MSSTSPFIGSKRKAREQRRSAAMNDRLHKIRVLAREIRSEAELQTYLAQIPDDAVRIEVSKLLEPFLPFRIQRVELAEPSAVAALGQIILAES